MEEQVTWVVLELAILLPGLGANLLLAWILLRNPKDLPPSKALGVQLVLIQLLFITISPLALVLRTVYDLQANHTAGNDTLSPSHHWVAPLDEGVYVFILATTPLLLAAMCVERFLAAVLPLLYLRARRWRFKLPVLAAVWLTTVGFIVPTVLKGLDQVLGYLLILIFILFLVMLSSLVGVAWSLWLQSPAHSAAAAAPQASPPLKRRALRNILVVTVLAVGAYLPLVFHVPSISRCVMMDHQSCESLNKILMFPLCGIFIGPLFYWAKARQVLCVGRAGRHRPG